jgi:CelD/BcsL family acetyltransferase involved in cellulose biosynthesis
VELLSATERDSVGSVWERLEAEGADPGPFASWEWTRTWLEHFGTTVSHCFAMVLSGREPLGVALLTFDRRRRGPFTFRRVHFGTAGEPSGETVFVERNRLVARPEDAAQVGAAIIRLVESLPGIDEIAVDGFVTDQATALVGPGAGWLLEPERCHVVDLAAAPGGDVAALFSPGVRKELRRAERALGPMTVEWADDADSGHEMLDDLISLHQARWTAKGLGGAFASHRVQRFHHALVTQWVPRGRLALMRVVSRQGLVGMRYAFVEGDRLLGYQSGWVPSGDRNVSAGLVLQHAVLQEAHQRGFTCWDYLAGTSEQKRRLSTGEYELVWATRRRPRLRWIAFDTARAVRSLGRME